MSNISIFFLFRQLPRPPRTSHPILPEANPASNNNEIDIAQKNSGQGQAPLLDDNLDELLDYLGWTSPECLDEVGRPLNAVPRSLLLDEELEKVVMTGVLGQKNNERELRESESDEKESR